MTAAKFVAQEPSGLVLTGRDERRGIDLFESPQRPPGVQGPGQHVSMAGAELHGHPDSCCCHALCRASACDVPQVAAS